MSSFEDETDVKLNIFSLILRKRTATTSKTEASRLDPPPLGLVFATTDMLILYILIHRAIPVLTTVNYRSK